ncbi:galactokinase [Nocardia jejuensis]|uniref:galactokinase n=1 Tax=Nocardia jejuensis TaxID=328049 RepID=UPI000ADF1EE5|nr:galactokinase [Nocardia jejuensis]
MDWTVGRWLAPGRVNLIGEHTDYNDGFVLPMALPLGVTCTAGIRTDGAVRVSSVQAPCDEVETTMTGLGSGGWSELPTWAHYPLGVIREFERRGYELPGVELALDGTVPLGAGLSSSAALSCSVAIALRDLYAPSVSDAEIIDIARTAENVYVGVPTGVLDQSASILCTEGHLLFLDVRTGATEQIPFDLNRFGLALLVFDTGSPHRLVEGEYSTRRAECAAAAEALGVPFLRDVRDSADVERLGDPLLRRRARHVVSEDFRVLLVAEELREGADPRSIGPTLTAGHISLRDDYEVSAPELDTAVDAALAAGAYGSRMVGGGFGGSVIALVDVDQVATVTDAVREAFARSGFDAPRDFVVTPSAGAHRLD